MKLLIVDPNVSLGSPCMKGVVRSLPALRRAGFEIELWCWDCDPDLEVDRIVRLPRVGAVRILYSHAFGLWARLRSWWRFSIRKDSRPDVIYTVAWYLPDCDVCHVHFSPWDWECRQKMLGTRSLRDRIDRISNRVSLRTANRFLRRTPARRVLCVSDAVACDVRRVSLRVASRLSVFPNSYDALRFNSEVRPRWRERTRKSLELADSDKVFLFASTGHYRRKGFFLAAESVALLRRKHPGVKLLVVGGTEKRLRRLKAELQKSIPHWREFLRFTGSTPDVEKYYAAADAFLFPSYSEAFALVEVEADACDLPLFLTRHHGSEMILEDGVNGRFLDFEPRSIAGVLGEFVTGAWVRRPSGKGRALDAADYAARFAELLTQVARTPHASSRAPLTLPSTKNERVEFSAAAPQSSVR